MIELIREPNPGDHTCDACDEELPAQHLAIRHTTRDTSRRLDLCERCGLTLGVGLVQDSQHFLSLPRT